MYVSVDGSGNNESKRDTIPYKSSLLRCTKSAIHTSREWMRVEVRSRYSSVVGKRRLKNFGCCFINWSVRCTRLGHSHGISLCSSSKFAMKCRSMSHLKRLRRRIPKIRAQYNQTRCSALLSCVVGDQPEYSLQSCHKGDPHRVLRS